MHNFLTIVLASFATTALAHDARTTPSSPTEGNSRVQLNVKGDIVRFYGIPTNLTPAGLKRLPYRYKVGHRYAEGDRYTFYTIRAQDAVDVEVSFHTGRLDGISTSSRNAVGPKGIGVGSLLSDVKAAWPEGRLNYGVEENQAFVVFHPEPGFTGITYYFDPKDMPSQAFDRDYRKSRDIAVPDIRVKSIGYLPPRFPEEDYSFLAVTDGPCVPKIGTRVKPEQQAICNRMTPMRRYRGTWLVGFETSLFAPIGRPSCAVPTSLEKCAELAGDLYFRPHSRWACPKLYRLEFIGHRNVLPASVPPYRITVDEVLAYSPLPDPPHEPGECDNEAQ